MCFYEQAVYERSTKTVTDLFEAVEYNENRWKRRPSHICP